MEEGGSALGGLLKPWLILVAGLQELSQARHALVVMSKRGCLQASRVALRVNKEIIDCRLLIGDIGVS